MQELIWHLIIHLKLFLFFCLCHRFKCFVPEEDRHGVCVQSFPGQRGKQNPGLREYPNFLFQHTSFFLYQILTFHCMLYVNLCSFSRLRSRNRCSCHFCWENFSPVSFHWMRVLLFCKKWPAPPADRWPPVFTCAEVFKVSSYLLIILKCLKTFETTCFAGFSYVYNFYFKSTVNILYCELFLYTFTCQVNELWLVCTGKHSLWEPTLNI